MSIVALIFLRETHPNILLSRKAARLRQEIGNPELFSKLDRHLTPPQILVGAFVRTGKLPAQIYLVDVFGSEAAASALGANILLRCFFGAFLPLAGHKLYERLNYAWGNILLGLLSLAFVPAPTLFYQFGGWLRSETPTSL